MIKMPYLLFLGDAVDQLAVKVGQGIKDWRSEQSIGQLRLAECNADLGLPDLTLEQGLEKVPKHWLLVWQIVVVCLVTHGKKS